MLLQTDPVSEASHAVSHTSLSNSHLFTGLTEREECAKVKIVAKRAVKHCQIAFLSKMEHLGASKTKQTNIHVTTLCKLLKVRVSTTSLSAKLNVYFAACLDIGIGEKDDSDPYSVIQVSEPSGVNFPISDLW